jgi:chromosome segregation ATPase
LPRDVLEEILSAALRENAIAAGSITDFAAGLKDRARLILEERLRPVEERVATLEKENAWRASAIESLTDENARVVDENGRVKDENARVREEDARLLDERERLKDESRRVQDENARVREEHARLLDERERLKDENALVRDEHARLLDERERLQDESRRLQDECRRLKEEMEGVRGEWRTASETHDRLLGHHRSVVRGAAASLLEIGALPIWRRGQARARLADLAAALGRDTA